MRDWAKAAREVHGDRYDYTRVQYAGAKRKVEIVCREHGAFWQAPDKHLNAKQGCPKCKKTAHVGVSEFLRRFEAVHGKRYTPVLHTYDKMFSPVEVVCSDHGVFSALPINLINKRTGCPQCAASCRGEAQRLTKEEFVSKAEQQFGGRYDYAAVDYVDSKTPVRVSCPDHGEFLKAPARHLYGQGCPQCALAQRVERTTKPVADFIFGARLLHNDKYDYTQFVYAGARVAGVIVCPEHGAFEQTPDAHLAGKGCSKCVHQVSRWEQEVGEFVTSLGVNWQRTKRVLPGGFELDIHAGDVAVECHGTYWHSTRFSGGPLRHLRKHLAAQSVGVRLLQVFEDEWRLRQSAVKNLVMSAFGAAHPVAARQCSVTEETSESVREFLDATHIQGGASGSAVYALWAGQEMVAAMVFSRVTSERGAVNAGWELVRYASKGTVVGGASRLFKRFLQDVRPDRVISYSDNRLFSGRMYEKLGFTKVHVTRPNYTVLVGAERKHKANFKKSRLVQRLGAEAVEGKTEREVCEAQGWYRVYDCGLTKWEWV